MNSVFPAKRTKLFEFQTLRMRFFVFIPRVITTAASGALKFYKFSHINLLSCKKILYDAKISDITPAPTV